MTNGWAASIGNAVSLKKDRKANHILKLAKQAHEKYLIKSQSADLENAIDYYIRVMKLDPSIAEPYYKLASLLWEKGQIDLNSAIAQCKNAISIEPNSPKARIYFGYFLRAAGLFEEAEREFYNAIKLNKIFSSRARLTLGICLFEKAQANAPSIKDFLKGMYYLSTGILFLCWDPGSLRVLSNSFFADFSIAAYRLKGLLFRSVRQYDLAVKNYETAATDTGKCEYFYDKAGDVSLNSGNAQNAVCLYKKALEYNVDNTSVWGKLASVLQLHYDDRVEEITECYNNLLKHDPENARIFYELGHLYTRLRDRISAMNAFKRATEIDPENPFYHNSLAYAYIQLKHYDDALSEYKRAIKLNPDNKWTSVVCQAQGSIYHKLKENYEAAITAYETAIVLDNENSDAYFSLAELYQEINEQDSAIENYCQALKLCPNDSKIYCCLGIALWEKDCQEEAMIAFEKSICIDPKNINAYNNLGVVHLDGTGDINKAIKSFKLALDQNPSYAMAYFNLGRAYQINRDNSLAAENYQMAYDLNKITEEMDSCEIESRLYDLFNA